MTQTQTIACNAGAISSLPGLGGSPGGGYGSPLQYSCLEDPMDRGAWRATVHRVTKSRTRLKWLRTHARIEDFQRYPLWVKENCFLFLICTEIFYYNWIINYIKWWFLKYIIIITLLLTFILSMHWLWKIHFLMLNLSCTCNKTLQSFFPP